MVVTSTRPWWVYCYVVICTGAPKGSTGSVSGLKHFGRRVHGLVSSDRLLKTGIERWTAKKFTVALLGRNQFRWVGLRFVCWFYDQNTQRLTESGFMEKPGIEPSTPGLQDIGLSLRHSSCCILNIPIKRVK